MGQVDVSPKVITVEDAQATTCPLIVEPCYADGCMAWVGDEREGYCAIMEGARSLIRIGAPPEPKPDLNIARGDTRS